MELEKQVTSLELAKRLKELGVPQESLFYWVTTVWEPELHLVTSLSLDVIDDTLGSAYTDSGREGDYWAVQESYSAFTVAELGKLLPPGYISWAGLQNGEMKWWCQHVQAHFSTQTFAATTEADTRAKMVIYLKEKSK